MSAPLSGMMRRTVLVLADFNETGGTGVYLLRLLEYASRRWSTRLVIRKSQERSHLVAEIRRMGIPVTSDYLLFLTIDRFLYKVFRRLRLDQFYLFLRDTLVRLRLEARYSPSLIFVSQGGGLDYFAFLASRRPVVMVTHSLFSSSVLDGFLGGLYIGLYDGIDAESKRICAVSNSARDLFVENIHHEVLASCVACVPNYGEEPNGTPRRGRGAVRVLTIGHVVDYKNPSVWLEVASSLRKKYGDGVEFAWAGDGGLYAEMRDRSRFLGGIEFLGYIEDVASLYADADIYFQPSILESQCMSVVDAMAWSIPCVVSDAGGLVDSIEDGKEGFVCGASRADQYEAAISRLIEDTGLRRELGENARRKYSLLFTKDAWESRMDAVISEIAGRGSAGSARR